jgi:PLP dependent protein
MAVNVEAYRRIKTLLTVQNTTLIAVSKTKPIEDIKTLYNEGQRDFGENYVQELVEKHAALPKDIRWHFIGHLQSNKAKYITPFVHLIHGIDSEKLLNEVNKQAKKNNRIIDCLLQVYIAKEETKFGFDRYEIDSLLPFNYSNICIKGLMGMASFSNNSEQIQQEFCYLKETYTHLQKSEALNILSMGMSGDYEIAIANGSNMVRIGSLLFGEREKKVL